MSYAALSRKPKSAGQSGAMPRSLRINKPNDSFEREVDPAMEEVMMEGSTRIGWSLPKLRSEPATAAASGDQKLDSTTRSFMESRFGHDFGGVRVRMGAEPSRAGALAYATGEELVFAPGTYAPGTPQGRLLLAHELAHVVQQSRGGGPTPSAQDVLEAEASQVAEMATAGEHAIVQRRAQPDKPLYQRSSGSAQSSFKANSDVLLNAEATSDVMQRGALFSGQDQAHVRVIRGRLTYDVNHTNPEDSFRWERLKDVVDSGHLEISAVPSAQKFSVSELAGGSSRLVNKSIDDIKLDVGDISVTGITLVRAATQGAIQATEQAAAGVPVTPVSGPLSASATHDQIFYDKDHLGALAHELFGHAWLASQGVPFLHPKPGTTGEATMGTLTARHGVTDPFGKVYAGTVRDYIAKFIESTGSEQRTLPSGQKVNVPVSPTQGVSQQQFRDALAAFLVEAKTGLGKKTTPSGTETFFTANLAQQLRKMSNNYDVLTDANDRKLIVDFLSDHWFKQKLSADQQDAFRDMLSQFSKRRGWSNQLSSDLESRVGLSKASQQMFQSPSMTTPGGLQLSNP